MRKITKIILIAVVAALLFALASARYKQAEVEAIDDKGSCDCDDDYGYFLPRSERCDCRRKHRHHHKPTPPCHEEPQPTPPTGGGGCTGGSGGGCGGSGGGCTGGSGGGCGGGCGGSGGGCPGQQGAGHENKPHVPKFNTTNFTNLTNGTNDDNTSSLTAQAFGLTTGQFAFGMSVGIVLPIVSLFF